MKAAREVGKEVEGEISGKLRIFFQKMNMEMKKDILKTVEDEFLSYNYGEDLENRLEAIQQGMAAIEARTNGNEPQKDKEVSWAAVESLQPRFNKIEKALESHRKAIQEQEKHHQTIEQLVNSQNQQELVKKNEAVMDELRKKLLESQKETLGLK